MKEIREEKEKYDWKKSFGSLITGIAPKKSVGFANELNSIMGSTNIMASHRINCNSNSNSIKNSRHQSEATSRNNSRMPSEANTHSIYKQIGSQDFTQAAE